MKTNIQQKRTNLKTWEWVVLFTFSAMIISWVTYLYYTKSPIGTGGICKTAMKDIWMEVGESNTYAVVQWTAENVTGAQYDIRGNMVVQRYSVECEVRIPVEVQP